MNREVVVDDYDVTIFIKEENRVRTKVGSTSFKIYSTMIEGAIGSERRIWSLFQNVAILLCISLISPVQRQVLFHIPRLLGI